MTEKKSTKKTAEEKTSKKETIEDKAKVSEEVSEKPVEEKKTAKKTDLKEEKETAEEKTSKKETKTPEVKEKKETAEEKPVEEKKTEVSEEKDKTKTEDTKKESSKKQTQKSKVKKEEAVVNGFSIPISTKDAIAICRFIKYKKIERAIEELEEVLKMRRAVPIKGEIPHRKGPGKIASGSGRFPLKASNYFIKLLGTLKANSENNGLENPVIAVAQANIASRPVARFGRARKKRSHVQIIAKERNKLRKEKNKQKK